MTLKEYRKLKKWSQGKVSKMLDISVPHISMIENGTRRPSPQLAQKIEIITDGAVPFKAQLIR